MIALPLEIWDNVVSQLASPQLEPLEEVYSTLSPDFAACAATCRLLCLSARPHLFHTITLFTATHAEALIELILYNKNILAWIRRLILDAGRSWSRRHRHPFSQVQMWLGTDAGRGLMDQLTSLDSLFIHNFELLSYTDDAQALVLSKGWAGILRLHSVTSLVLRNCNIPSLNEVAEMLTGAYPNLNSFYIMEFYLETRPDPSLSAAALPARIQHPNLRTLTLRNDNPGEHDINTLLGSLDCPALTHLTLAPTQGNDDVITLKYAQPLLSSAKALTNLTLLGCDILDSDDSPLLLSSNGAIQHISVQQISEDLSPTWIPDLLASLMTPSQLQTLELTVNSLINLPEIWQALDQALCDCRFRCEKGGRVLRVAHSYAKAEFEDVPLSKAHFSRTHELGWFRIEWPDKQAGLEQDVEEDSDGED